MQYVIKNILSLVKKEKLLFILMILCVFVSSSVISFSYGLYCNYIKVKQEGITDSYYFNIDYKDYYGNEKITLGDVLKTLKKFSPETLQAIDYFTVYIDYDDTNIEIQDMGEDGKVLSNLYNFEQRFYYDITTDSFCENQDYSSMLKNAINSGRMYTVDEYIKGEKVAVVSDAFYDGNVLSSKDFIELNNVKYKIIGKTTWFASIPINAFPDDTIIKGYCSIVAFTFKLPVTRSQYNEIVNLFNSQSYSDLIKADDMTFSQEDSSYFNTIILIIILISLISAINLAILYQYIIMTREKRIAIFWLCGSSRLKLRRILITEILLSTSPVFLLSTVIYHNFTLKYLSTIFPYINDAYSLKNYILMFIIYFIVSYIILNIMIAKSVSNISNNLRKGGTK